MEIVKRLKTKIILWQYSRISKGLSNNPPEYHFATAEKKILEAVKRVSKRVPFYESFYRNHGVKASQIKSIDQFIQIVPVVDKHTVFGLNSLTDICLDGHIDDVCLVYSSSGYSNKLSFGAETWRNRTRTAIGLEFLLNTSFDIFKNKTFIINCLPMGVKIFTHSIPIAETSVRDDVVLGILFQLKNLFDQFILIGESPFLKKVVEEGIKKKMPWHDIKIHLITGGEYIPESYRSYMASLLHIDLENPATGIIAVNMGISELSLSILCENFETIQLRRKAAKDKKFRKALMGREINNPPLIMQYFPQQTWLETLHDEHGWPQLIVTMLDSNIKIPLIRYNTGDCVRLLTYDEMKKVICDFGYDSLLPQFKLPFGIILGKRIGVSSMNGDEINVHEIKEALYDDHTFASKITGNFRIQNTDDTIQILVQMKDQEQSSLEDKKLFYRLLKNYTGTAVQIQLIPYREFPYGIEHNYEKKNRYSEN